LAGIDNAIIHCHRSFPTRRSPAPFARSFLVELDACGLVRRRQPIESG
jgi:hypothetical protein